MARAPPGQASSQAPLQYLSQEWAEQALRLIETDAGVREQLDGLRLSLLTIILNPPKGCYGFLYAAFDDSGLADYRVGHDFSTITSGMPEPTFVVSGDYKVFASVQRGELSERRALLSGKLHLTGSMVKALRHMRALEAITAAFAAIPCVT